MTAIVDTRLRIEKRLVERPRLSLGKHAGVHRDQRQRTDHQAIRRQVRVALRKAGELR